MAEHKIVLDDTTKVLDVSYFNTKAAATGTAFSNGDTGIFVDAQQQSLMPSGRYYTYNNNLWFLNVVTSEFDELKNGYASEFRTTLNSNFSEIKDQADTIDKNLEVLKNKLKKVATTAKAEDITEDTEHRFCTDANKQYWNERGVYVANDQSTGNNYMYYNNGGSTVDITNAWVNYLQSRIPTKTSDLGDDDDTYLLVSQSGYHNPDSYYWNLTYPADITVADSSVAEATNYGWVKTFTYSNSNITSDHVPYVFFTGTTMTNGAFSPMCVSENGAIKFGYLSTTLPSSFTTTIAIVESGSFPASP